MMKKTLTAQVEHVVLFHEADMLGIVWHGHYLRFFEMAREEFSRRFGLGVPELREARVAAPVVKAEVKYKAPARYGDTLVVEAAHVLERAPKFSIAYKVLEKGSRRLLAQGRTVQLFTSPGGEVFYFPPPVLEAFWKRWEEVK